jgi:hypothetical protein
MHLIIKASFLNSSFLQVKEWHQYKDLLTLVYLNLHKGFHINEL